MRAFLMTLTVFLTAVCFAANGADPAQQALQPQPKDLLDAVKKNRASVYPKMLAYIESARSLCVQIVLAYPESPQAKEACDLLGELYELTDLMTDESDPMAGVQTRAAGEMWEQAEHYADMDPAASLRSAEFIYREIIRRYPGSRRAVDSAMRLTQLSAALSAITLWEQAERQAALHTREGLRAAEHFCKEVIRLYPESPQAIGAAQKLLEVSTALKKLPIPPQQPEPEPTREEPATAPAADADGKPAFSFDTDAEDEWRLPKPEDLYAKPSGNMP